MTDITVWQFFLMGGPLMWPILLASVFLLTVIIDKAAAFSLVEMEARSLKENVFSEVRKNNIKGALAACDGSRSFCGRLFKAGLVRSGGPKEEIARAMEEVVAFEMPRLEKTMPAIATISQVAPLLGLLGTILGLGSTFHIIQVHAQALNPVTVEDIAAGVWQSLISTVFGLIVGITAILTYNYFVTRLHLAVRGMEKNAADLVNFMMRISDAADPDP